jgi:hypothetical protein
MGLHCTDVRVTFADVPEAPVEAPGKPVAPPETTTYALARIDALLASLA